MKKRLADRLPPGALDAYDASVKDAEHRRALKVAYRPETLRNYRYRLTNYQRWCQMRGYQTDIAFLSDARAEEYVRHQSTVDRFSYDTIKQSLVALRYYAERAGLDPMPSFKPAYAVLHTYRAAVAAALERAKGDGLV